MIVVDRVQQEMDGRSPKQEPNARRFGAYERIVPIPHEKGRNIARGR